MTKQSRHITDGERDVIADLLIGHKLVKISVDTLVADNGVTLRFVGNEGCGGCSSGWYYLKELSGVDNIITAVAFEDTPPSANKYGIEVCKIFVIAGCKLINLATFEGDEGNGYYGRGYHIVASVDRDTINNAK